MEGESLRAVCRDPAVPGASTVFRRLCAHPGFREHYACARELYSPAAPKFNVVSRPNDWTKAVGEAARRIGAEALTETKLQQLEFWTGFREFLLAEKSPVRSQKPFPQHWMNFSIGRTGFNLTVPDGWEPPKELRSVRLPLERIFGSSGVRGLRSCMP
jgi:hypothetical protein